MWDGIQPEVELKLCPVNLTVWMNEFFFQLQKIEEVPDIYRIYGKRAEV